MALPAPLVKIELTSLRFPTARPWVPMRTSVTALAWLLAVTSAACSAEPENYHPDTIDLEVSDGGSWIRIPAFPMTEGITSTFGDIEVHMQGDVLFIGPDRYAPVQIGDHVKISDAGVTINGTLREPLP